MHEIQLDLIDQIKLGTVLGEGVTWDGRTGDVLFTDVQGKRFHRYNLSSKTLDSTVLDERLTAFGLTRDAEWLIAAFESGFAWFHARDNVIHWLERPEADDTGRRFNDGRVGPDGRFWCGTMIEDAKKAAGVKGRLFRLDPDGAVTPALNDIVISNSLSWSPDGATMYFADSPARVIWAFDYEQESGAISNKRIFAETPEGIYPDGAAVDADGFLWSAQWGGARVARYAPDGREAAIVPVPVSQPSCVEFGGEDLDLLLVTTAQESLSAQALAKEPGAGDVFIYKTPVKGAPSPIFGAEPPKP